MTIIDQTDRKNIGMLKKLDGLVEKIHNDKLIGNSPLFLYSNYCIGIVYYYLEYYSISRDYLKKAAVLFAGLNDIQSLEIKVNICYTLGSCYSKLNDYVKAEKYYHQGYLLINTEKKLRIQIYHDFWMSYSQNAYRSINYEMALERLDSAGRYLQGLPGDILANYYNCKGLTLMRLNRYKEADVSFLRAIESRRSVTPVNHKDFSRDLQNYSELLLKTGIFIGVEEQIVS